MESETQNTDGTDPSKMEEKSEQNSSQSESIENASKSENDSQNGVNSTDENVSIGVIKPPKKEEDPYHVITVKAAEAKVQFDQELHDLQSLPLCSPLIEQSLDGGGWLSMGKGKAEISSMDVRPLLLISSQYQNFLRTYTNKLSNNERIIGARVSSLEMQSRFALQKASSAANDFKSLEYQFRDLDKMERTIFQLNNSLKHLISNIDRVMKLLPEGDRPESLSAYVSLAKAARIAAGDSATSPLRKPTSSALFQDMKGATELGKSVVSKIITGVAQISRENSFADLLSLGRESEDKGKNVEKSSLSNSQKEERKEVNAEDTIIEKKEVEDQQKAFEDEQKQEEKALESWLDDAEEEDKQE
eukprot:TRINITY_DN7333_c0_g3_i1.p1 TRINITY_DN7333_c0_g3~~TRINITY_DN7333_c0_g3_i1.p1  ORF type:complete len:360 (+),score=133.45 TRINITY_DN7333_c0_g3_i1:325-1404(+)